MENVRFFGIYDINYAYLYIITSILGRNCVWNVYNVAVLKNILGL